MSATTFVLIILSIIVVLQAFVLQAISKDLIATEKELEDTRKAVSLLCDVVEKQVLQENDNSDAILKAFEGMSKLANLIGDFHTNHTNIEQELTKLKESIEKEIM